MLPQVTEDDPEVEYRFHKPEVKTNEREKCDQLPSCVAHRKERS